MKKKKEKLKKRKEKVMAKGWNTVYTNSTDSKREKKTVGQKRQENIKFNTLIKKTESLSIPALKKEAEDLYDAKVAEEDKLVNLFNDKKLKNKATIKKAIRIKKMREMAEKEAANAFAEVVEG
jgi:hypothetical protein